MDSDFFRYIPISPRDADWGLFVTTAGHARTPPDSPYPPTRHPQGYHFSWESGRVLHEHQIVYLTKGEGAFESEHGGKKRVEAGSALLLFPDEWHRYAPSKSTGWEEYWVGFEGDYFRRLIDRHFFSTSDPVFTPGHQPELVAAFTDLLDLLKKQPVGYQQVMAATTHLLLSRLLASAQAKDVGDDVDATVREAKCLLLERIDEPVDIEALASELGLGYAWFRQVFKRHTGLAPHQYHLQLRINKARQLLSGTDAKIRHIADQLGFDDVHYFCRIFRKKTGQTPVEWRRYARGHSVRKSRHASPSHNDAEVE